MLHDASDGESAISASDPENSIVKCLFKKSGSSV